MAQFQESQISQAQMSLSYAYKQKKENGDLQIRQTILLLFL